jgi:cell division protein FtsQ
MPSNRRPSYRTAARRPPAARGDSAASDVISASKDGNAPGAAPAAAAGHAAGPAAGTKQKALPGRDNVLSFPEPKAKRRRRIRQGIIGALAVLVAGIIAAAV